MLVQATDNFTTWFETVSPEIQIGARPALALKIFGPGAGPNPAVAYFMPAVIGLSQILTQPLFVAQSGVTLKKVTSPVGWGYTCVTVYISPMLSLTFRPTPKSGSCEQYPPSLGP